MSPRMVDVCSPRATHRIRVVRIGARRRPERHSDEWARCACGMRPRATDLCVRSATQKALIVVKVGVRQRAESLAGEEMRGDEGIALPSASNTHKFYHPRPNDSFDRMTGDGCDCRCLLDVSPTWMSGRKHGSCSAGAKAVSAGWEPHLSCTPMLTRGEPRVDERVDISTSVVAGLKRVEQVGDDADGAEHSLDLVQVGPGRVEHGEYRQV